MAGGGHFGLKKTHHAIRDKYFWPKMFAQIETYIKTCDICQRTKVLRNKPPPPLSPLPVGEPFSRVHIDILGPLPKAKEQPYQYVVLIVDSFTKWTEAFPLVKTEAKDVASVLYDEFFTRYGAPHTLVSDRGQNFMSKLVKALCELFEVKRIHTSSYHPQTNSACERRNSTMIQSMRSYINKDQTNWPSLIPSIMMAFRAVPCESTGYSPHELLFGRKMRLPIDTTLCPKPTLPLDVRQHFEQLIEKLKVSHEIAKANMQEQSQKSKARYDVHAKTPTLKVGDKVMMKQEHTEKGLSPKLTEKWVGPFEITELGPNYTYKLKNLQNDKILQAFKNACKLKFYHERSLEDSQTDQTETELQNDRLVPLPDQPFPQQPAGNQTMPQPTAEQPSSSKKHDLNERKANRNKTNETTQSNEEYRSALTDDIRIIGASKKGIKQWYKILWPDNFKQWIWAEYVNERIIREYLKNFTQQGKRRKFKSRFFVKSQNA